MLKYLFALCASIPAITIAEPGEASSPLVSDRPDFTESAETVPNKRMQLEGGYTFTQDSSDGVTMRDHALPELLLRVGLCESAEARLGWTGAEISKPSAGRGEHGASDMSIGTKVAIGQIQSVSVSAILDMELPVGSQNRTADRVQPGTKLIWSAALSDTTSLTGNINYASRAANHDRFNEWGASVSIGTPLAEKVGGYMEYFGIFPSSTDQAKDESYLNGGVTYSINDDLQLDARLGGGLNNNAADLFTGFGFAWRY